MFYCTLGVVKFANYLFYSTTLLIISDFLASGATNVILIPLLFQSVRPQGDLLENLAVYVLWINLKVFQTP